MRQSAAWTSSSTATPHPAAADATLAALLEAEGLAGRRIAVEVNGEIVPRGQHGGLVLHEGDRIEIVHALGGG
jgi:sulfur carrier protein